MPQLSFQKRTLPMPLRVAGSLVFLQAAILLLAGAFVVLVGAVLGSANSVPFAGKMLSGASAVALGLAYVALAITAAFLNVQLGRLVHWIRPALICFEALLIVLFMAQGELSINMIFNVILCLAVAVLLVTPTVGAALSGSRPAQDGDSAPRASQG
jgi:hypothetical protein